MAGFSHKNALNGRLIKAAEDGDFDQLRMLLAMGADKNTESLLRAGFTPIYAAIRAQHYDIAAYLLTWNIDLSVQDARGKTVIDLVIDQVEAGRKGAETMAAALIKAASPELLNARDGVRLPMHVMAAEGNVALLQVFIDCGCYIDLMNADRQTPMMWAVLAGNRASTDYLISQGATLRLRDSESENALHYALQAMALRIPGAEDCAIALVNAGIDFSKPNADNILPLHLAVDCGGAGLIRALALKGCDMNSFGANGATALMTAAGKGHADCVQTLLDHGADVSVERKDGRTAVHVAVEGHHHDVLLVFQRWAEKLRQDKKAKVHASLQSGTSRAISTGKKILKPGKPPRP